MDKKHKEMDVLLAGGDRVKIVIDSVQGLFAIHQRVCDGRPIGEGWTVSHFASGMALWTVLTKDSALSIANWLQNQNIIPAEPAAVIAWRDGMTVHERSELINRLTAIAPRYMTPWRAT